MKCTGAGVWDDYVRESVAGRCQALIHALGAAPPGTVGPELGFEECLGAALDAASLRLYAGIPEEDLREAWRTWREQAWQGAEDVCRKWLRGSVELLRGFEDAEPGSLEFKGLLAQLSSSDERFRSLAVRPGTQQRLAAECLEELQKARARGRIGKEDEDEVDAAED
ncbi:unnamed protein product [Prorocentrum cordatum]|uniref:Uncharacterized protein n=1 Tax=Prorocentrum cordatum TaxID=2364126 RepID=A0ABN9T2D3_9DINO|nr:unnamed protein product [Polarella glacialis]